MRLFCALILSVSSGIALADVYKCVEADPAGGAAHVTYTNTAKGKNCTRLSQDLPVSSVPGATRPKSTAPAASGQGFPRVSESDQRKRDDDRRTILEAELEAEEKALEVARTELAKEDAVRYGNEKNFQRKLDRLQPFQDTVEQHERNVEALKKELRNLR